MVYIDLIWFDLIYVITHTKMFGHCQINKKIIEKLEYYHYYYHQQLQSKGMKTGLD